MVHFEFERISSDLVLVPLAVLLAHKLRSAPLILSLLDTGGGGKGEMLSMYAVESLPLSITQLRLSSAHIGQFPYALNFFSCMLNRRAG